MTRRNFLIKMSALYGMSIVPSFARSDEANKRLVVIFLRGAVDGLNVVVPTFESMYYDSRPNIALKNTIELEQGFAANSALSPIMELWQDRQLAFVHACGLAQPNRSHFEAQDVMERGVALVNDTSKEGWLTRLGRCLPTNGALNQSLSLTHEIPKIFSGSSHVATFPLSGNPFKATAVDKPIIEHAFDTLYSSDDLLDKAYQESRATRKILMNDLVKDMILASPDSIAATGFAKDAAMLGTMIKNDPKIQSVFLSIGGWDTHINQGADKGVLSNKLADLANGLSVLKNSLSNVFNDTLIIVMSEFGRTVRENGTGGTDHGYANAMWLIGGTVDGKHVRGQWPGLDIDHLIEGRDLAVTLDYRRIISNELSSHFSLNAKGLHSIFPGI